MFSINMCCSVEDTMEIEQRQQTKMCRKLGSRNSQTLHNIMCVIQVKTLHKKGLRTTDAVKSMA